MVHTTKNGKRIQLQDLTDSHLVNIIKYIKQVSKCGVTVEFGGGSCPNDFWYDRDTLFNQKAKDCMHYNEYIAEAKRRKLREIVRTS